MAKQTRVNIPPASQLGIPTNNIWVWQFLSPSQEGTLLLTVPWGIYTTLSKYVNTGIVLTGKQA